MTVGELTQQLKAFDPKTEIAIVRETNESLDFFDVGHVSLGVGTPTRDAKGKACFKFDNDGPDRWVFIHADEG